MVRSPTPLRAARTNAKPTCRAVGSCRRHHAIKGRRSSSAVAAAEPSSGAEAQEVPVKTRYAAPPRNPHRTRYWPRSAAARPPTALSRILRGFRSKPRVKVVDITSKRQKMDNILTTLTSKKALSKSTAFSQDRPVGTTEFGTGCAARRSHANNSY